MSLSCAFLVGRVGGMANYLTTQDGAQLGGKDRIQPVFQTAKKGNNPKLSGPCQLFIGDTK